jgi:hypothetical protein
MCRDHDQGVLARDQGVSASAAASCGHQPWSLGRTTITIRECQRVIRECRRVPLLPVVINHGVSGALRSQSWSASARSGSADDQGVQGLPQT